MTELMLRMYITQQFNRSITTSIDTDQDDQQVLLNFLPAQIFADELSE